MKKNKKFLKFILLIIAICFFGKLSINVKGYDDDNITIQELIYEVFGDIEIKDIKILYSLDDSPDYVYVSFNDKGYCVFLSANCELLEYNLDHFDVCGSIQEKIYYIGPFAFLKKMDDGDFLNIYSNEIIEGETILNNDNVKISELFSDGNNNNSNLLCNEYSSNSKNIFGENTKSAVTSEKSVYIENKEYFYSNPSIGNNTGKFLCGAVAAQLLLSYHNYYTDRRIIEPMYLNGGWNNNLGNNDRFDPQNYDYPENDPNVCSKYNEMNWFTLGSNGRTETENNTFFKKMVENIPSNAMYLTVKSGIKDYLDERNKMLSEDINYEVSAHIPTLIFGSVDPTGIVSEINNNRPVIVLLQASLGALSDHYVVAYGYRYIISQFNDFEYSGYLVHNGYADPDSLSLAPTWVNASYCFSYITLNVIHQHDYTIDTEFDVNNYERELRCSICGHREGFDIYNVSENTIVSTNYLLKGNITIPSIINGININNIGDAVFENNQMITNVNISSSIKTIGDYAFKGCANLKTVEFSGVLDIGDYAFEGCSSLENVNIPETVIDIGIHAFKNCVDLENITINRENDYITELGANAFYGCSSLNTIQVPGSRILEYKNAPNWKVYQSKITSNAVFEEVDINCYSNLTETLDVNKGENAILKINVECSKSYKITASSTDYYIIFKLYDSNMQEINVSPTMSNNECTGVITYTLSKGVYYVSVKYTADAFDGTASINIQLSWTNNNYFGYETSNVLTHLHYVDGELINHSIYTNNYGRGLYKVSINGNLQSYQNVLTIYDNVNKLEPMKRIETSLYELDAVTSMVSNNLVVYLQEGQNYYIDIVVPNGTLFLLK